MPDQSPRATTSGPRSQRKRPGDLTGVRGQQLAAERDKAQEEEAQYRASAKAEERTELLSTVIDYSQGGVVEEVAVPDRPEDDHPEFMVIRVNYEIEQMTFGREVISPPVFDENGMLTQAAVLGGMQTYNFKEGAQYKVPWELGRHLQSLGYVYDF